MQFDIQARGFPMNDGLREHTERRLQFALGWAEAYVRRIVVRLVDIDSLRSGEDKRCGIRISFPDAQEVVIEDAEADLQVAIDRAADRAKRLVARRLQRQRDEPPGGRASAAPPAAASSTRDVTRSRASRRI